MTVILPKPRAARIPHVVSKALIGTTTRVRPDELRTFHKNARRGNIDVIVDSLATNDQYRPIVVNIGTYTGRANEILAGNHTLQAIRRLAEEQPTDPRWSEVAVYWGDWDEHTCTKIVIADNQTADKGGMDFAQLKDLLADLPDLSGTGYTDLDLSALNQSLDLRDLSSPSDESDDSHEPDGFVRLSLKLDAEVVTAWVAHRKHHESDTAALMAAIG
jgi:hypothetical protein